MYNHSSSPPAQGTGLRVSYPSKVTVGIQIPAPVIDRRQYENYVSYQSQRKNIPPLPSTHTPQYPLDLNVQYAPQDTVPATITPSTRSNGAEHAMSPVVDHQVLLLALAEEYLQAAHKLGSITASQRRDVDLKRYYKLIATGLGCLECLLQRWRLQPYTEALVRLRYATVLYEETENVAQAETALSKGITLCERNRFVDLKHSMQHLLARVVFRRNPKAAMKLIDGVLEEVEAYQRIPWVYMFRFLRVSLCLELSSTHGINNALQTLQVISKIAKTFNDQGVLLVAAVLEALVHLSSSSHDHLEQTQRAIATARSLQLTGLTSQLPQLVLLTQILDLFCSLMEPNPQQATHKMQELLPLLDQTSNDPSWSRDGMFSVLLSDIYGSTRLGPSGQAMDRMIFEWLSNRDVCKLGYFLCGVALSQNTHSNSNRADKYFRIAGRTAPPIIEDDGRTCSFSSACSSLSWRKMLDGYVRVHLALFHCYRAQWDVAGKYLDELQSEGNFFAAAEMEPLPSLIQYLAGVIHQGSGRLNAAVSVFRGASFDLSAESCTAPRNSAQRTQRDIAILGTLNTILIVRGDDHHRSEYNDLDVGQLTSSVESLCTSSSNKAIRLAMNFIRASSKDGGQAVLKPKEHIKHALQGAQSLENTQLICMTLALVNGKFFRGVIGDQAEKGAKAALNQAKLSQNKLWISVTKGMYADTLEVQGKMNEARAAREDAVRLTEAIFPTTTD
ncbi:MAG: hypothetical protein M1816_000260 [Peltula sp. TS41687]|nr:MAG: hypothetical protein M1816_000260 [Peltula sp. TS41687]